VVVRLVVAARLAAAARQAQVVRLVVATRLAAAARLAVVVRLVVAARLAAAAPSTPAPEVFVMIRPSRKRPASWRSSFVSRRSAATYLAQVAQAAG
jgi:hypothetical protein